MDTADAPPPAADGTAPPPREGGRPASRTLWHRLRRALGGLLALGLLAVALALGALAGLLKGDDSAAWVLARVPGLVASGVQGSPFGERLRIARLEWQLPGEAGTLLVEGLELTQPRWQWRPGEGPAPRPWFRLDASALAAQRVAWRSGPPAAAPPPLPATLRLPFALDLAAVRVGRVEIDALPPLLDVAAAVSLGRDGGARHHLDGVALRVERARVEGGLLRIEADAPFLLAAELRATGEAAPGRPAWDARLAAQGPLAAPAATATLRGSGRTGPAAPPGGGDAADAGARLELAATLRPFERWPLGALQLSTQDLDLAVFSERAPHTRFSGRADVASRGLDQPVAVQLELRNALPGRWDAGRLPLREARLQLSGTPQALDRLALRELQATLGDDTSAAGRLSGEGAWDGRSLQLALALDDLQPARLDRRAPALRLGGPLTLVVEGLPSPAALREGRPWPAASALAARLQAAFTGQALAGPPVPVRLELKAEAADGRLQLPQASARAGEAVAQASGEARRQPDGRWALRAEGELQRFDPRLWWPGEAGSAWRQGPHRLQGRWSAELSSPPPAGTGLGAAAPATVDGVATALRRWRGRAALQLADSQLAGVPVSLQATLAAQPEASRLELRAEAGPNRLVLDGRLADDARRDHWDLSLQWPQAAALAPLARLWPALQPFWPTAGEAEAEARIDGRWPTLRSEGSARTRGLRSAGGQAGRVDAQWRVGTDDDTPWLLRVEARDLAQGRASLQSLALELDGNRRRHRLQLALESALRPPAWAESLLGVGAGGSGTGTRAELRGSGEWQPERAGGGGWRGRAALLRLAARVAGAQGGVWFETRDVDAELRLDAEGDPVEARLAAGRALLPGGAALRWDEARWQDRGGSGGGGNATRRDEIDLRAELEPLPVAPWLARLQPDLGWRGDLTIGARLVVRAREKFEAELVLERARGDLSITDDAGQAQALGVSDLRLAVSAQDGNWQFTQAVAGAQLGEMAGAVVARTDAAQRWPPAQTPIDGVIQMRVANLGAWGTWVPPGWRLAGTLTTSAIFGGRFGAPELRGEMRGSGLGVRNALQGVNVSDGELALTLDGAVASVERFRFKAGEGTLTLSGGATLGAQPSARLTAMAERLRVLGRIDRRLEVSGRTELRLAGGQVWLEGGVDVDEGLIDFSRADAPSLDGDVVVMRSGAAAGEAAQAALLERAGVGRVATEAAAPAAGPRDSVHLQLRLGMGERLRLKGRGLDTTLSGDLELTSPGNRLTVKGTVRTAGGTYAAYGQRMEIQRGEVVFSGPLDNPRLDVRAVRPNLDVLVGVAVTGTTASPRVRLFSEPELSDLDKLSWLVLGRAADGLGRTDTALLQRAAVALLAGEGRAPTDSLLEAIGLTDFSLRQTDGEVRETVVSLGRQLSRRWYVGYERSVNATSGTWQLIYRIAQRFTLRAQSGAENSLDLIWSWRW